MATKVTLKLTQANYELLGLTTQSGSENLRDVVAQSDIISSMSLTASGALGAKGGYAVEIYDNTGALIKADHGGPATPPYIQARAADAESGDPNFTDLTVAKLGGNGGTVVFKLYGTSRDGYFAAQVQGQNPWATVKFTGNGSIIMTVPIVAETV